ATGPGGRPLAARALPPDTDDNQIDRRSETRRGAGNRPDEDIDALEHGHPAEKDHRSTIEPRVRRSRRLIVCGKQRVHVDASGIDPVAYVLALHMSAGDDNRAVTRKEAALPGRPAILIHESAGA